MKTRRPPTRRRKRSSPPPPWALLPSNRELHHLAAGIETAAENKREKARQQWLAENFPRLIPIGGRLVPTEPHPDCQETNR